MTALAIALLAVVNAADLPKVQPERWEAEAAERIERHRKGDFAVIVLDADGRPVPGANVSVEMTRHGFPFGTALWAPNLVGTPQEAERTGGRSPITADEVARYRREAARLFNRGTLGNHYKWAWQARPERRAVADAATDWMLNHGMTIHAHVLIWATLKYGVPMPQDVEDVLTGDAMADATPRQRAEFLRQRSLEHVADTALHYRGRVVEWDVVNENTSEHELTKMIDPDQPKERAPMLIEWFDAARAADPNATLFVNDFHILVGDYTEHKDSYEKQIEYLMEHDAPLGGIGMQGHYHAGGLRRTPGQLMETLDRFARFGLPIQVTEFDTFGGGWGETRDLREAGEAEWLRQFYTIAFSHPAINGITMWGFWDGRHWANNAPLFRRDWSAKPAHDVYTQLVFDDWWTRENGTSGDTGNFDFRGFYGTYAVTAEFGNRVGRATATLNDDGATAVVRLPR